LSDYLPSVDLRGSVFNNCAFATDSFGLSFEAELEDMGVTVYKPIFTKYQKLDDSRDFSKGGITWVRCEATDLNLGVLTQETVTFSSRFRETQFENCVFGIEFKGKSPTDSSAFVDCSFDQSTFRSNSMLQSIRSCVFFGCLFDRVSVDLERYKGASLVDLQTTVMLARGKQLSELVGKYGELSEFQNCTFQGLRPTRRTTTYSIGVVSDRVIRFPQKGIETCTFDVYFPAQDTFIFRDGTRVYSVINAELEFVFSGRGYGDPLYPTVFENSDKCRTLLEVIEMNNICDRYVGIELSALKRAKAVIFRLWMDVKDLHLVGVDPSKDITQFGMELAGCLEECTFENVGLHFHPQLEDLHKANYHLDTYYSKFAECEIHSLSSPLKIGYGSVFQGCKLHGEFDICIDLEKNSVGDYSYTLPQLTQCDLRSATVRLVKEHGSSFTSQAVQDARNAMVYMFQECQVGEDTRISIENDELSLENLLGEEFSGCFTLENVR